MDNGSEFCSRVLAAWAYQHGVRLDFIRPGRPVAQGFIESFNGKLRDEGLNTEIFCVNQPWKTQARVREVMSRLYQSTPEGLCGDEDTGQMSAWYVFSALGFYPVSPGPPEYQIGSPLFDRVTISLSGGKKVVVTAKQNGPQRPYIRNAWLNGGEFHRSFLKPQQITTGGELVFDLTSAPEKWATGVQSRSVSAMTPILGKPDAGGVSRWVLVQLIPAGVAGRIGFVLIWLNCHLRGGRTS